MARMKQSGFTLVETLIASVLLFTILVMVAWAYGFFVGNFNNSKDKSQAAQLAFRQSIIARYVIDGIFPYYLPDRSVGVRQALNQSKPFFSGNAEQFSSITELSTTEVNTPSIVTVMYNRDAGKIVVCTSRFTSGFLQNVPEKSEVCDNELTLIDNIQDATIDYYGWSNIEDYLLMRNQPGAPPIQLRWRENYDAMTTGMMPSIVRISMTDANTNNYTVEFAIWGRDDNKMFHHRRGSNAG